MLAIAILSGINLLASLIYNIGYEDKFDVNLLTAAVFVLSTWQSCLPLAIIAMVLVFILFLLNL